MTQDRIKIILSRSSRNVLQKHKTKTVSFLFQLIIAGDVLPNLAPCAPMLNKNTETENWKLRNGEAFYFLCQAKGRHSRLTPRELCPPPWGIGKDFIRGAHGLG